MFANIVLHSDGINENVLQDEAGQTLWDHHPLPQVRYLVCFSTIDFIYKVKKDLASLRAACVLTLRWEA